MDAQVKSVSHALAIMRHLASGQPQTLSEVARACALSPSTCLALLRTLSAERVLVAATGKRYALAPAWHENVTQWADPQAQVVAAAQPLLAKLARTLEAPVGLWRVVPRERLQLVALGESKAPTRIHMAIGQRQPIGGGATGRALAAAQRLDERAVAARFAAVRWESPLDLETYRRQIMDAARDGYAVDDRFGHAGVRSVAVVVVGAEPALCLSASFFADVALRWTLAAVGEQLKALGAELIDQSSARLKSVVE
ncbi:IclR family transcriptional regulator domain-containing protein [Sphingomonas radiodurans]|uniref:IclR family transcriptional regulator domain-containing protein n=1 Tax=Sphingomonas radiodurans TaxID=2890321 RepID=UPI001E60273F|nr:helix-turn-helix domain-containing protein [Sphingomonas radiodurans]WBH15632.1 helix-turn-helix domain-containing protein [Sphingomonas radiodurans]